MAAPNDDPPPAERPAQAGEAIVTEIVRDDGRLLLLYRWPGPAS